MHGALTALACLFRLRLQREILSPDSQRVSWMKSHLRCDSVTGGAALGGTAHSFAVGFTALARLLHGWSSPRLTGFSWHSLLCAAPTPAARKRVAASLARDTMEHGGDMRSTFIQASGEVAWGSLVHLGSS